MNSGSPSTTEICSTPPSRNWSEALAEFKKTETFQNTLAFVEQERRAGKEVFPQNGQIFNALKFTELSAVKVVILGQDPYHGPGQAHGLSFSVQRGVQPPPSLQNMFREIADDLGSPVPAHGCLEKWALQGVLLLNSVLTVEQGKPASHRGLGWEEFTDEVIRIVNRSCESIVFMLWGSYAQKKGAFIDGRKHLILKAPHPSPLSAHRGFLGCRHFSRCNTFLLESGKTPIDWSLDQ